MQAVLVDLVMVEQRAARRLADTDALQVVDTRRGHAGGRRAGPGRRADARCASTPARISIKSGVVVQNDEVTVRPTRSRYSSSSPSASGVPHPRTDVEPRQRTDPVDAVRVTHRRDSRANFRYESGCDRLADEVAVVGPRRVRRRRCGPSESSTRIAAVVVFPVAVGTDQAHEERSGSCRRPRPPRGKPIEQPLEPAQRDLDGRLRLRDAGADRVAASARERLAHAAGDRPGRDGSSCRRGAR